MTERNQQWAEKAFAGDGGVELPFSFVYGGQPSAGFIAAWPHQVQEEVLDATRRRRTLTLSDPATGLEVRAVAMLYSDTPAVEWTLYFSNKGTQDTPILEQVQAVDVTIHPTGESAPVLHRLLGSVCKVDDWLPLNDPLPKGKQVAFAPRDGRPSKGICPFFNLQWGDGGVITAIGWSGQWTATVEHTAEGLLRIRAGQQYLHLTLRPGETIRGPRILQMYWQGQDELASYNAFRRVMFAHIMRQVDGVPIPPPIVHLSTSFYELNDSTEANVLSHLEPIKGLGFEYFWLDAYWTRDGFPKGMGHYGFPLQRAEPPDRFPHGLKPISEAAHREGMGFLVWFEPERVAPGTHLDREHPEWVISVNKERDRLFNLGIPEACEYMTRYLIAVIEAYGMDSLRIDYNIDPLPFWRKLDEQDATRQGLAEIRYVEGLYRMWDAILQAYPRLLIDNCASGGMRIDLETCSRSVPLWRTDATIGPLWRPDFNQAALQNQLMTAGLSRYMPFNTSGMMGATPYWFRSGYNAGISFCEDCRPADYPRELLKRGIAEGKRIRKYFYGNYYPLNEVSTSPEVWCVLQYHRPAEGDGLLLAFRRHQSPYGTFACQLREIDVQAEYEVTLAYDYTPLPPVRVKGADLQHYTLMIGDCPGSVILEYKKVGG